MGAGQGWGRRGLALALVAAALACGDESTPSPSAPEPQPVPSAAEVRAELEGMSFDAFLERSFEILLQRSPMTVIELGLEDRIDVGERFLDDLSDEFARASEEVERTILELARAQDAGALDPEQRIALDAYVWYLDDRVRGRAFSDLEYRVAPGVNSVPVSTQLFFTDVHPVAGAADAERYVQRLDAVGWQMRQVRDVMERTEEAGIVTPRILISWSLGGIEAIAGAAPESTPYYQALAARLAPLGLDDAARDDLLARAAAAIEDSVIPGYRALADLVADQETRAPDQIGVWQHDGGDDYYAHALSHHVTAEVTAAELHQLGLDELERIHGELEQRFDALGYPAGAPLRDQIARVAQDSGLVPAPDVVSAYTAIIEDARARLPEVFDVLPTADVVVTGVPSGGFYVGPSLDNSRPGAFFATVSDGGEYRFGMRSLAYHEALPGHHLQIGIAHDLDLPLFQRVIVFTGFVEGWALYAEWLAGDLGWYEGDVPGDVGRLQAEAFRAARLVVDTGIHDEGWSFDQAVDSFADSTGFPRRFAEGQVARYASWPGQATSYWMGRTRILALRRAAEDALGDAFDARAFHRAVLTRGSVPLDVLDGAVASDLELPARRPDGR